MSTTSSIISSYFGKKKTEIVAKRPAYVTSRTTYPHALAIDLTAESDEETSLEQSPQHSSTHLPPNVPNTLNKETIPEDQEHLPVDASQHPMPASDDRAENPFAQFAFDTKKPVNPFARFSKGSTSSKEKPTIAKVAVPSAKKNQSAKHAKDRRPHQRHGAPKADKGMQQASSKDSWVRMGELPKEEVERIRTKWHSLAVATDTLETKRFQVLIASRLHARCQETTVRKALEKLEANLGGKFTVDSLAKADPEQLATSSLSSLQFYNVKARHIVKASKEILSQFNGEVPETVTELQSITGIGPVMADLLSVINTRRAYCHEDK